MTQKQSSSLLLCCGALHDIAEICRDKDASKKVTEIQLKIEKIVVKKVK